MKPIETLYKGYKFRSRLEARWAVFFDALGLEWEYEPEGFVLSDGVWYLPDFWLPQVTAWAEVKPYDFSEPEKQKASLLAKETGHAVFMLIGVPDAKPYDVILPSQDHSQGYPGNVSLFYIERKFKNDPDFMRNIKAALSKYESAVLAAKQARFEHGESG